MDCLIQVVSNAGLTKLQKSRVLMTFMKAALEKIMSKGEQAVEVVHNFKVNFIHVSHIDFVMCNFFRFCHLQFFLLCASLPDEIFIAYP